MIIDCIADLHGYYPELEGGDLLIVAGDLTARDRGKQYEDFNTWLLSQEYKKKILVAGNHDNFLMKEDVANLVCMGSTYLCDSGTEFEALKIWGSPWTPWFHGVNPACKAFMKSDNKLLKIWEKIPHDIDILVTHGPPFGILDGIPLPFDGTLHHVGSSTLRNKVLQGEYFKNLKLHIFGHIHEQGGNVFETSLCRFVNASYVNEKYQPVNKPVRVIL